MDEERKKWKEKTEPAKGKENEAGKEMEEDEELKEERLHSRGTDALKDKPGPQTLPRRKTLPAPSCATVLDC